MAGLIETGKEHVAVDPDPTSPMISICSLTVSTSQQKMFVFTLDLLIKDGSLV